jgi:hypothetical protein
VTIHLCVRVGALGTRSVHVVASLQARVTDLVAAT